jgi:hypothetical protein
MFALEGSTIALALIAAVVAPTMLWLLQSLTKRQDWARQDAVAKAARGAADEAKAAATAIVAANEQSTKAVHELTDLTQAHTGDIAEIKENGKTAVHLADGALTAAKKGERAALALLVAYKMGSAEPPTDQEISAVKALDDEIATREASVALATAEATNNHTPPAGQAITS